MGTQTSGTQLSNQDVDANVWSADMYFRGRRITRVLMHHVMRGNTDLGLDGNIIIHFVRGRCSLDCRDEEVGDLLTQFEDASGDVERLGRLLYPDAHSFLGMLNLLRRGPAGTSPWGERSLSSRWPALEPARNMALEYEEHYDE